jgi:putative ABC transport system permease protein
MKKELTDKQYGNTYIGFTLEPFYKVHLHSPYDGFEANSNIKYVYIIGAMALLILLIACFTYINLSVARSIERAREIGIRKSVGALKIKSFGNS